MDSPHTSLTFATRRQFLGRCTAGLALAYGARLSAQDSSALKWSGLRIPTTRFCPADGFNVTFKAKFGTYDPCVLTFEGGPGGTGLRAMPNVDMSFVPKDGLMSLWFRAWLRTTNVLKDFEIPDVQPERTYTVELDTIRGRALKATIATRLGEIHSRYPGTRAMHLTIQQV